MAPANVITATRAGLAAAVAGLGAGPPTPERAALVVALGTVAALLDLADGWVARRTGTASAFGARFDMEVDAALVLVLSILVWRFDITGPWVLAAGLMRYLFVAAAVAWPWMARPLPPSRRRQAICVVQIVALLAALAPVVPPRLALAAAATGLAALTWSFALDVGWLHRRRHALLG
ncbi:MAG: CDP-alcohol phosphatidyltransferase family protein [Vicinamibacterales bacterium]